MISQSRVLRAAKKEVRIQIKCNGRFELLTLDGDDQLGNDGKDLSASLFEHVEDTLHGKEAVGVLLFTDTFEENGEVVMVIELHNVDLPLDFVLGTVFNGNGEISAVVEATEFGGNNSATLNGTSDGLLGRGLGLGLLEGSGLSTNAISLLEDGLSTGSNRALSVGDEGNGEDVLLLLVEVLDGEVTEGRVLGFGEELVHGELPGLAVSLGEHLLEVVLDNHGGGKVDFGHTNLLDVTHL